MFVLLPTLITKTVSTTLPKAKTARPERKDPMRTQQERGTEMRHAPWGFMALDRQLALV